MAIDLKNFFKYYNSEEHQEEAVELLEREMQRFAPQLLKDNSTWVEVYRKQTITKVDNVVLPVRGVALIKEFEGFFSNAYPDPLSGNLPITIGYGATRKLDGSAFVIGDKITEEEATKLLEIQLEKNYYRILEDTIPYWNEMNENQRGALLSFAYNLGAHFYGNSGFNTISKMLKEKQWNKVPDAMYLYRNPGTSVERGLARRRIAEGNLWKGV